MTGPFVFRDEAGNFAWQHGDEDIYDALAEIADLGGSDEEIAERCYEYLKAAFESRRLH